MITLTSGIHLTATNKRVISEMIARGMTEGVSGRITYRLDEKDEPGSYAVTISQVERNDYGKPIDRIRRVTITHKA